MQKLLINLVLFGSIALSLLISNRASAQSVVVDQPAVCYTCHDDIEEQQDLKNVHGAFASGECSSCHNPHASRHAALLNEDVAQTCFECHDEIATEIAMSNPHQPALNGECLSCHDPHASNFRGVLKESAGKLCLSCHENAEQWLARANVHAPVASRDCATCHAAHGSANQDLLTEAMPQVCFDCHDNDAAFKRVHKGYDLASADCAACHDPHSSSSKGLLMANQHAPFAAGECSSCHSGGASAGSSFAMSGAIDKVCFECHDDIKANKRLRYSYHLEAEGSCTNCHNPHASNASTLLSSDQSNLCMKCHFTEVPSKDRPKFITHEGQDCSICHAPHGADNERYLTNDNVMELCNGCHADAHKNSHPMGDEAIDPRTELPMDCLSCHTMHGSGQDFYLAFDPDMDLCIQCHKR